MKRVIPTSRRVRVARGSVVGSATQNAESKKACERLLSQLITATENAEKAALQVKEIQEKLTAELKGSGVKAASVSGWSAEIVPEFSRASRTIRPRDFRKMVLEDDFWSAITVSVTKAKQLLSERELESITDVTASVKTGETLKVVPPKARK